MCIFSCVSCLRNNAYSSADLSNTALPYSAVTFRHVTYERHTTARPRGRGMGCLREFYICMMTSSNGNIFRVTGLCVGNSPVTGEFLAQRPVTRNFDVFFDLRLNKWLSKQSWGWWFETAAPIMTSLLWTKVSTLCLLCCVQRYLLTETHHPQATISQVTGDDAVTTYALAEKIICSQTNSEKIQTGYG